MQKAYAIAVRAATPADVPMIARLSQKVFRETFVEEFAIPYAPDDVARFLADSHGPQALARRLAEPDFRAWVAEADGQLAGYATAGPTGLPHPDAKREDGELYRLYVDRAFHGSGAARALMGEAMAWLAARPVQWIGVWSENLRAQRFYARYGFEKAGEYDYPVGRTIDREFILRRGR